MSPASAGYPGRASTPRVIAFSASAIPTAMILVLVTTFIQPFYASLGVPLVAIGAAFTIVRLIDIAFDPFIGVVMDKTRTRFGRYRPWMMLSAPLLMVSIPMLCMPPEGVTRNYLILWLVPYYAGLSLLVLSHTAWAAALARTYHDRSRVYGWMQAIGVIGSALLTLAPVWSLGQIKPGEPDGMRMLGWLICAAVPICTLIVCIFAPEPVSVDAPKERVGFKDYARILARPTVLRLVLSDLFAALAVGVTSPIYFFFFHDAKGFSAAETSALLAPYLVIGLVGAPFWAFVANRLGKHRTLQVSTLCFAVAQGTLMALPKGAFVLTSLGMAGVGFCAAAFILLIRAMVADAADEIRLEEGRERAGLLYALITSTQKIAAAVCVTVVYAILQFIGYNAVRGAVNTPEAILGLQMCYVFAPVVLGMLAGAVFFGYPLNAKRHAEIRAALDARDEALAAERASVSQAAAPQVGPAPLAEPGR